MIKLIDKQTLTFGVENNTFQFVKPYYIMPSNEFKLLKATVKGSTIVWNIYGTEISYNQLKKVLK